jgi:predicted ribosomally synthesized peptide with SipW-like signal peptide
MKLLKVKNLAMMGALSIAGVGLIGVGAHATFSASTNSVQQVTAGTLSMGLTGPAGSTCLVYDASSSCTTLALPPAGPEPSTFTTGDQSLTATNDGNITATNIEITATDPDALDNAASLAFDNEAWVCMIAIDGGTSWVVANESLDYFIAHPQGVGGTEAPGQIAPYTTAIFAGQATNECGAQPNGTYFTTGQAPAPDTLAPAAGLDNSAEGGVIDPTITITYSG